MEFEILWKMLLSSFNAAGYEVKDKLGRQSAVLSFQTSRQNTLRLTLDNTQGRQQLLCQLLAFISPPVTKSEIDTLLLEHPISSDMELVEEENDDGTTSYLLTLSTYLSQHGAIITIRRLLIFRDYLIRHLKTISVTA